MQICKENRLSSFYNIDLSLLQYINNSACQSYLSFTYFINNFAFYFCAKELCCNSCHYQFFNLVANIGRVKNNQANFKTMSIEKFHKVSSMYLLKYLKIRKQKDITAYKIVVKKYKLCIYKKEQKILLLALSPENTIVRIHLQRQILR